MMSYGKHLGSVAAALLHDVREIAKIQPGTDAHIVVFNGDVIINQCFSIGAAQELWETREEELEVIQRYASVGRKEAAAIRARVMQTYYADMATPQQCLDMARIKVISRNDAAIRAMFHRHVEAVNKHSLTRETALQLANDFANTNRMCVVAAILYAKAYPGTTLAAAQLFFDDGSGRLDVEYPATEFKKQLARFTSSAGAAVSDRCTRPLL